MKFLLSIIISLWVATTAAQEQKVVPIGNLELLSGEILEDVQVGYITAGELNADKSNVILLPSWFMGTAREQLDFAYVGPGRLADTDRYFVVAVDALGNGVSTSPSNSGSQAGAAYPTIAIGDMVRSQYRLLTQHLGIEHLHAVIGFSMGGMQAFDWVGRYPAFMDHAVAINGSPRLSAQGLLKWGIEKQIIGVMRADGRTDEEIFPVLDALTKLTLRTPDWMVENIGAEDISTFLESGSTASKSSYDYEVQLDAMTALEVYGNTAQSERTYADRVKAKMLVIAGARDQTVHPASAKRAAAVLGAEYFESDSNCGHLVIVCENEAIRSRVHRFLHERD